MNERGAIDLIEQATRLYRAAGVATLSLYYIGALPFLLGFLFFWADMSRDAYAYQRIMPESLMVAGLFLWMNVWQTFYTAALRRRLDGSAPNRWTTRRVLRAAALQCAVQPTSLIVIPAGLLLALPLAWIYGFYQNFTVLADGEELALGPRLAQARAYALLWTRQSWTILAIQAGFTLVVAANVALTLFLLPRLLQIFLGVETVFTRSGANLLSSTFFAVCLGVTYLCVDPLMKAIYVLRCFYAESVRSGEDLKAELRQSAAAGSQ
jgi:hypothetical protein